MKKFNEFETVIIGSGQAGLSVSLPPEGGDSPGTMEQRTHDSTPATSGQTYLSVTWY